MSAHPPLPELSDDLTLLEKIRYRQRQMENIAGLIEAAQADGSDLSWVPDAAVRFLRGAAASIERWATEIDSAADGRGRTRG